MNVFEDYLDVLGITDLAIRKHFRMHLRGKAGEWFESVRIELEGLS